MLKVPLTLALRFQAPFSKLRCDETEARTCSHARTPRVQITTREARRCVTEAHLNPLLCHRRNALPLPPAAYSFDCVAVEFLWVAVLGSFDFAVCRESW